MNMDDEWAKYLADNGIKFREEKDYIIFYDPKEKQGTVVVRRHDKEDPKNDMYGYYSYRTGTIDYNKFERLPNAIRNV